MAQLGTIHGFLWQSGVVGLYALFGLFFLWVFWPDIKRRVWPPIFTLRPIHGDSLEAQFHGEPCMAKLAIKNTSGAPMTRCSVRLESSYMVHFTGDVLEYYRPSVSDARGESFFLRWSAREAASADRKFLDIPDDDMEHVADLLEITPAFHGGALFCAANPAELPTLGWIDDGRWWKLVVVVSADQGAARFTLIAACSERDGPIPVYHWEDQGDGQLYGEKVVAAIKREHDEEEEKNNRKRELEREARN